MQCLSSEAVGPAVLCHRVFQGIVYGRIGAIVIFARGVKPECGQQHSLVAAPFARIARKRSLSMSRLQPLGLFKQGRQLPRTEVRGLRRA
jgi:hypothetical protein